MSVRIWDIKTRQKMFEVKSDTGEVWSVDQHPTGKYFAYGTSEDIVHVVQNSGHRDIKKFTGYSVAFSPTGRALATSSLDGTVRLYNTKPGRPNMSLQAIKKGSLVIQFSPTGRLLATAGLDQVVTLLDAKTGEERSRLKHAGPVLMVAFSPNGDMLATSTSNNEITQLWQPNPGQKVGNAPGAP